MAPKKTGKGQAGSGGRRKPDSSSPSVALTPENFRTELESVNQSSFSSRRKKAGVQAALYLKSLSILLLAAVYSNVSQLNLSPLYGSIPSAVAHAKVVTLACFVGWSVNGLLARVMLPYKPILLLPLVAWFVPVLQYALGFFTKQLGTSWGPVLTELVTLFPLTTVSVSVVATWLEHADLSVLPPWLGDALPGFMSYGFYKFAEGVCEKSLPTYIGTNFFLTRIGLEVLLGLVYTAVAPSKLLLLALPAVFHTAFFNTHAMHGLAMKNLQIHHEAEGWRILDRAESLTGYLSVIENTDAGFRVLRCDHSLLGGEWTKFPAEIVAEPIYGVFAMLEAVRLVNTAEAIRDHEATALVIGLGVGTSPAALVMHGIETTVVEIDPAVHSLASQYFHLPANHTPVIEDAVKFVRGRAAIATADSWRFDYIIHDVFTGGAEPVTLFTVEFVGHLSTLLKDNGVIAINYAGDFMLPSPALVVRTVKSVFPVCRIFREVPKESDEDIQAHGRGDFTNMVIFCTKSTDGDLSFRSMLPEDTLKSRARMGYMMPKHEIKAEDIYGTAGDDDDNAIVRDNETARLSIWHEHTASGHWKVMRTVIPPVIWEMW